MLEPANAISLIRGSSKDFNLTVLDDTGHFVDLTGARVVLGVKGHRSDPAPKLVKDSLQAGHVDFPNPRAGEAVLHFAPADTYYLDPGPYVFDLWIVFQDGRRVPVIEESTLEVVESVVRLSL